MAKNKMKTRRAAAKRFTLTGSGKLKRHKAYKSHKTAKKSPDRKRRLRKGTLASRADEKRIKKLLQY
ncbi:MAG: 50S ribosomal protein L35 [Peptoniphilaceae bacterium]|nr:50S ribosomal protein L35 [Peptoniphilaceae bacterium]MDY6018451.1 50S ribosomal protein L35 [Anaerococcus sp.]